jgi:hypothetical protein
MLSRVCRVDPMCSNQVDNSDEVPPDRGAVVLYRFDDTERVVLLDSETTIPGSVTLEAVSRAGVRCLRVRYQQGADPACGSEGRPDGQTAEPAEIVIALPVVAVDGDPGQLVLDVFGDASGCEVAIEAADAAMRRVRCCVGTVDFTGWGTCRANVRRVFEDPGTLGSDAPVPFTPPVQFLRLRITPPEGCTSVDLSFGSLSITGDVRVVPSGLAGGSC